MGTPLARVEVQTEGGRAVVRVIGEVDLSNADALLGRLHEAAGHAERVALDLSEVAYLDSKGLRMVNDLANLLDVEGVALTVIAPEGSIAAEVLALAGMDALLDIRRSLDG